MNKGVVAAVVLCVAVFSFWVGGRYGNGSSAGRDSEGGRKIQYFVDPMNPGFRSDKPGIAPCGMPLEPVYAEAGEGQENSSAGAEASGAVKISPARQQMIGVKVRAVEKNPMTSFLRLYGRVVPDETRVHVVNSSTDCWIRELSDVTTGSIVRKDQILGEALAPAYYNAQVTYLISLGNIDRIREQMGGELRHQQGEMADNQIRMAVQALQNLGITDAQTRELANTRQARPYLQVRSPVHGVVLSRKVTLNQWFKASEAFYTIADIERVWVYADVYENEAQHLRPGMAVEIVHSQLRKTLSAKVSEVLPLFDPVAKTLKVRVDVDNARYDLRPDMFVDVRIPITLPSSVNVPTDAIIDSGTRTIVYVDLGNGLFEPRRIKTGRRLGRQVEITDGLAPGEKIIVSGNFLIDSESRMRTSVSGAEAGLEEIAMKRDPVGGKGVTAADTGDGRSWAELLEPARDDQSVERKRKRKGVSATANEKDNSGKYPTSPEVVDWNGPDKKGAPPPAWGKWGAFPGSKYLGTKKDTSGKAAPPSEADLSEPPVRTAESDEPDKSHEHLPEIQEPPAPARPQPSAAP